MTPGERFDISKEELLCLGAMCGHETVLNLEYAPEYTEEEAVAAVGRIKKQLLQRGWTQEDFEGRVRFADGVTDIADLMCTATYLWMVQTDTNREGGSAELTVYGLNGRALVLQPVNDENVAGWLYNGLAAARDAVLERFPLKGGEKESDGATLTPDELAELADGQECCLINYSRYLVDQGRVLCESAVTCAMLEKAGAFNMEVDDNKEFFVSIDQGGYEKIVETLFDVQEGKL